MSETNMRSFSDPGGTAMAQGQDRFVADVEETALRGTDTVDEQAPSGSLYLDAWRTLRKRPLFIIGAVIALFFIFVAIAPDVVSSTNPKFCELGNSMDGPSGSHWFGFDRQGCDIYSRVIHGARASVVVGVVGTALVVLVGGVLGALAGFYGGVWDALISRVVDIFFAVPFLLGAIVGMQAFSERSVWVVAGVLAAFGWPQVARIMRGSVISLRSSEYVTAARALGASRLKTLTSHVIPNALPPVIVIATITLGTFIGAEATLSFLGIGLDPSVVSWGGDINKAQSSLRTAPEVLLYPAGALSLTVLSFIFLGDALRDALDPKARTR